jgi:hypothetical protein
MTAIDKLAAVVRRAEANRGHGRNAAATLATAKLHYRNAVAAAIRVEDAYGVNDDAAERYDRRLRTWRGRAIAVGLLSPSACVALEAEAIDGFDAREVGRVGPVQGRHPGRPRRPLALGLARRPLRRPLRELIGSDPHSTIGAACTPHRHTCRT